LSFADASEGIDGLRSVFDLAYDALMPASFKAEMEISR
jgi:hypothetical protein